MDDSSHAAAAGREPGARDTGGGGTWMGAFERVMGDQADGAFGGSASNGGGGGAAAAAAAAAGGAASSKQRSAKHLTRSPDPHRQSVVGFGLLARDDGASSASGTGPGAAGMLATRSGHTSPLRNLVEDHNSLSARRRLRSGSLGTAPIGFGSGSGAGMAMNVRSGNRPITPRSLSAGLARTAQESSGPSLVSITPAQGPILFEGLYMNHAPGVQLVHVVNLTDDHRILLRLSSTLGRALAFSRLKRPMQDVKEPITYPTNTVEWAQQQGLHPSKLRDLRHLISNLEPSDSLLLEAKQELDVYLTFRPTEVESSKTTLLVPPHSPTPGSDRPAAALRDEAGISNQPSNASDPSLSSRSAPDAATIVQGDSQHQLIHAVETNGSVTIRASILSSLEGLPEESAALLEGGLSSNASNLSSSSSSRPPSFFSSHRSSTTSAPTTDFASQEDNQVIQIPFCALSCRPQLSVTRHRHHGRPLQQSATGAITLDFGDIFVGLHEEMDIHLHNLSEIDLFWQARLDDADNMLGMPPISILGDEGPLPSVTSGDDIPFKPVLLPELLSKRLRIAVDPHEPCRNYEQVITITNLHNASNSFRIIVRANMLAEARDDALSILSGNVLDFGDCAGGHWTRQLLILKNTCEQFLDVHFNVEKGVEADFQLAELAQRGDEEEEKVFQEEPPLLVEASSVEGSSIGTFSESEGSEKSRQRSPNLESDNLLQHNKSSAAESARTPTSYAQLPVTQDDPPFFALPGQDGRVDGDVRKKGSEDDVDASSVASQAGSLPGSPVRSRPVELSNDIILEPPPSSAREGVSEIGSSSDGDRKFRSRPSSFLFSDRPSSRGLFSQARTHDGIVDDAASTRSDVTAVSHDSRIGPFLSSGSHGGGSASQHHAEKQRLVRHGGAAALKGLRGHEQAHGNQIEELILRPGAEYRVIVSHRPVRGELDETYSHGRLQEKKFHIMLDYTRLKSSGAKSGGGRERKTVECRTRTCTSFISISPNVIDFGLANVGTRKSSNFVVHNHSELTARVDLRFISKVISMYRDEIAVPPLQSIELRVDFFPRRVNENYRKQVTVANLLNRANDEILEVRSSNVDEQRISFHSLFYRILTSTGSNFIDFGDVNINCTRLRSFGIENVSGARLALELSAANPEDLKLYVKAEQSESPDKKGSRRKASKENQEGVKTRSAESETSKAGKAKRTAHLKERFLETISHDVSASARTENSTWRLAQAQSHVAGKGKGIGKGGEKSEKKETVKKANVNVFAALKKGGKGRLTQRYGRCITFKDRTLLSNFEYLDLATGPPVDGKRISSKSKKYQTLDANVTGRSASAAKKKAPDLDQISTPTRKLPSALADEIQQAGSKRTESTSRRQSPALTGKRKAAPMLHDAIDVSKLSLDELIAAVETQSSSLSTFFLGNPRAEEQSVRTEVNLQRELRNAINEGRLQPVDVLTLEPNEDRQVLAIYSPNGSTRPHIQGNARKQDSRIFIRLADFSTEFLGPVEGDFATLLKMDRDELPVRDLMVKSNLCRSLLELSQPHINFGHVQKGETKTRKIVVQNRSEWALRYCIRKSGSIASGDIKLKSTDRYGVVPGHGRREVEFVFCPSLTGAFQERLTVENVADRDRDETVLIKANVTRVSNFSVEPASISFTSEEEETLVVDRVSNAVQSFTVSNMSSKPRSFVIHIDDDELKHGAFHVEVILSTRAHEDGVKATLSKAEEEEVEHISQKLKIASRKGQTDKIHKYKSRLTELGVPIKSDLSASDADGNGRQEPLTEEPQQVDDDAQQGQSASVLDRISSRVTIDLPPQQSKRLLVRLRPLRVRKPDHDYRSEMSTFEVRIPVQVHEVKNIDEVQIVETRARIRATKSIGPESGQDRAGAAIELPSKEEGLAIFSSRRTEDDFATVSARAGIDTERA